MIKIILPLLLIISLSTGAFFYFFTGNPRDLGIRYTDADYQSAYTKNAVESVPITEADTSIKNSIRYEGKKDINVTLTGPEITALNAGRKWKFKTAHDVQFKINSDGTGEISGKLNTANVLPYISLTHSTAEVEKAMKDYKIGINPPFYLKGKVSITNNRVKFQSQQVEIGRITIPHDLVQKNIPALEDFVNTRLSSVPNLYVRSLTTENGQVKIDATIPEKEFTVQN